MRRTCFEPAEPVCRLHGPCPHTSRPAEAENCIGVRRFWLYISAMRSRCLESPLFIIAFIRSTTKSLSLQSFFLALHSSLLSFLEKRSRPVLFELYYCYLPSFELNDFTSLDRYINREDEAINPLPRPC